MNIQIMPKKIFFAFIILINYYAFSQNTANRFFYEFTFEKKADTVQYEKILTILDITTNKSIYRDYLTVSQDSLIQDAMDRAQKSGIRVDINKIMKFPKFTYKVVKNYPIKEITYFDKILQDEMGYTEQIPFKWKISKEKLKIGDYETQKATTEYGGRKWTAWFSNSLPFSDGPYKFYGLPGLIVKIEDSEGKFSWALAGNKKISNYSELSLADRGTRSNTENKIGLTIPKEKFLKIYDDYLNNPLGSVKGKMTPEQLSQKMPDGRTVSESFRDEEEKIKKLLNSNRIDIEINIPQKK